MRIHTYVQRNITIQLETRDRFRTHNENGLPFLAGTVSASFSNKSEKEVCDGFVKVRGFAIRADGSPGIINREARIPVPALPSDLRKAFIETVKKVMKE